MSSKAAAAALASYGAELKIKNIVSEIFFSILPPVYMSEFKLIDATDELIVDLFFQYTKSTLQQRKEYGQVAQNIVLETYPDLRLDELSSTQISLLAQLAIKKVVFKAVNTISNKLYQDSPTAISNFDPGIQKKKFASLFINELLVLENTNKLSFLNPKDLTLAGAALVDLDRKQDYRNIPPEFDDFTHPRYCFETYIKLEAKDLQDIMLCTQELTSIDKDGLREVIGEIIKMFTLFYSGKSAKVSTGLGDFGFITGNLNLGAMAGKTAICSVDDLEAYYYLNPVLNNSQQKFYLSSEDVAKIYNSVFKSITLGIRCSLDRAVGPTKFITNKMEEKGFPEKTVFYLKEIKRVAVGGVFDTTSTQHRFTVVLAKKEQQFDPAKIETVIEEGKKSNSMNLNKVFQFTSIPTDIPIIEGLLIELVKTKEFDALVKSILVPALLFNAISVIPNIEIARDIIPLMRKSGVFKGMDDVLNEMFSSLNGYLLGDFPWSKDCADVAGLI
tara:strand:+ start:11538 stop:13040 length:1503 start_codon:yes stop_codon:yes gene_type:complete